MRYNRVLRSFPVEMALLMPAGGRSLTIPNQAIRIGEALKRYSAPSIVERLKGYYEEEGMEMPNFEKLDKIERLQLLADATAKVNESKRKAREAIDKANAAAEKALADKEKNNPIPSPSNNDNNGK